MATGWRHIASVRKRFQGGQIRHPKEDLVKDLDTVKLLNLGMDCPSADMAAILQYCLN